MKTTLVIALAGLLPVLVAANPAFPTPGEYRIDVESTMRSSVAGIGSEQIQKVDGDTGRTTVVQRDLASGQLTAPQVHPGEGPNRWCVPAGPQTPPLSKAAMGATACTTTVRQLDKTTAMTRAVCRGMTLEERWQRIDERTWERQTRPTMTGSTGQQADAARSGLAAIPAASLTPAQRAELAGAKAAMPSPAQADSAVAGIIAQLESAARSKDPEEAAAAKQMLVAVRAQTGGTTAGGPTMEAKERWRRVADTCKAG